MSRAEVNLAPTWLERTMRHISPALAESRYQSRVAFEARATMAAAKTDRSNLGWRSVSGNLNDTIKADRRVIGQRARYLAMGTSHGTSAITGLSDSVVGTGIRAHCACQFGDTSSEAGKLEQLRLRQMADDARIAWNAMPDWDGVAGWEDLEGISFRETLIDGNAILREMINPNWRQQGLTIPLQYQAIRADRLTSAAREVHAGNEVIDGIEVDATGRKVAYHIADDGYTMRVHRVPASEIVHLYRQDFPGQRIGWSWFTPVIPEMQQFEDVKEYALIARKVQSAIALVISRDPNGRAVPIPGLGGQTPTADSKASPLRAIEPGMIHDIGSGSVHSHNPSPSGDLDTLTRLLLRSIGVGFGVSYEVISGDFSNVNFAGGRLGVLQTRKRVSTIHNFFTRRLERPIHQRFVQYSLAFNPAYPRATFGPADAVKFSQPKFDWGVNPAQEVKAAIDAIAAGLSNMEIEVGALGRDWQAVMQQNAAELNLEASFDLAHPIHPASRASLQYSQQQPADAAAKETEQ